MPRPPALEGELAFCPVGSFQEPNLHCVHWDEGGSCCYCNADPVVHRQPIDIPTVFRRVFRPIDVVCPACRAAVTARCTEPKPLGIGGFQFIDRFHPERIALARGAA